MGRPGSPALPEICGTPLGADSGLNRKNVWGWAKFSLCSVDFACS